MRAEVEPTRVENRVSQLVCSCTQRKCNPYSGGWLLHARLVAQYRDYSDNALHKVMRQGSDVTLSPLSNHRTLCIHSKSANHPLNGT